MTTAADSMMPPTVLADRLIVRLACLDLLRVVAMMFLPFV
jgi:hypothetical protein